MIRRIGKQCAAQLPNQPLAPLTLSVCNASDEDADAGQGAVARRGVAALQWACRGRARGCLLHHNTASSRGLCGATT